MHVGLHARPAQCNTAPPPWAPLLLRPCVPRDSPSHAPIPATQATLGLSIQIPVATVAELLVGPHTPHWLTSSTNTALAVLGTACIIAGFVGFNLSVMAAEHAGAAATGGGAASMAAASALEGSAGSPEAAPLQPRLVHRREGSDSRDGWPGSSGSGLGEAGVFGGDQGADGLGRDWGPGVRPGVRGKTGRGRGGLMHRGGASVGGRGGELGADIEAARL